jgi:hypothetical protein
MNINLVISEKPAELDEFLDQDEMELPPFQFALVELSQYIDGYIKILFKNKLSIVLDLFSDFMICFDNIIDSINAAKSSYAKREEIWFCEQGSDFYLYYEVKEKKIHLTFKKGKSVGRVNKDTPDFDAEVDTLEYIKQWKDIFQKLDILFEEKLHKKIPITF